MTGFACIICKCVVVIEVYVLFELECNAQND